MTRSVADIRGAAKAATAQILRSYATEIAARAAGAQVNPADVAKYALITTPRVGSTMFCRKLHKTGRLGWPTEWLNDRYAAAFIEVMGEIRADAYLDTVIRGSTTANGVFGLSFHVHQYHAWRKRGLDVLNLGFRKIYWIERRDRFDQAYSYAKGIKTDLWSREFEAAAGFPDGIQVEVSPHEVAAAHDSLEKEIGLVPTLFPRIDRRFIYEEIIGDDCTSAVNAILADFGEAPLAATAPGLPRQSSEADHEQRERLRRHFFAAENR